jgi:hypothetical protein
MDKDKLLFTVSRKDLQVEFFRAGGPGGQHQNKTSSACRITHKASGAVGESRQERKQHQNRKIALRRLADSEKFRKWVRIQSAMVAQGFRDIEDKVDKSMGPINLKVEHVVKYTCDECRGQATVTFIEGDPPGLPKGWIEDDLFHYCPQCRARR